MIFRYKETVIEFNKNIRVALAKIYGVGLTKSNYVCDMVGYGSNYNIDYSNRYFFECISVLIKNNYLVEDRLKMLIQQRLKFFFDIKLLKGIRYFDGLPVHGQRTHANGMTAKLNKVD
jgi:ribosomal protein S13